MSKLNPRFTATVKNGELLMFNPQEFSKFLIPFEGEKFYVVIKKEQNPRSIQQNRYYWGVIIKLLSDHTGYSPEEMHYALRSLFLRKRLEFETKKGILEQFIPKSTTELTTVQFETYTENIRRWSAVELSVNIPTPNEVDYES